MDHLTVEEMIDFVSFNKIGDDTLKLASKVTAHVIRCDACREKVSAFQLLYDEFVKMGRDRSLGDFMKINDVPDEIDAGAVLKKGPEI